MLCYSPCFLYKFFSPTTTLKKKFLLHANSNGGSIENRFVNESSIRLSRHPSNDSWASCQQEARQSTSKPETPLLQTKQTLSNNAFDPRHTVLSHGELRAQAINMGNRGELRKTGEKSNGSNHEDKKKEGRKKEKKRKRKKITDLSDPLGFQTRTYATLATHYVRTLFSSFFQVTVRTYSLDSTDRRTSNLIYRCPLHDSVFPIFLPTYFCNFHFTLIVILKSEIID